MALQTNQTKKNSISTIAGDFWLKYNPHRKAENMTGKMASDEVHAAYGRSPVWLFDKAPSERETKAPLLVAKQSNKVTRFNKDLTVFERRLQAGQLIKFSDAIFEGRSKQTIFLMIKRLRESNPDLITISGANKEAIGWMLQSKLEDVLNQA